MYLQNFYYRDRDIHLYIVTKNYENICNLKGRRVVIKNLPIENFSII